MPKNPLPGYWQSFRSFLRTYRAALREEYILLLCCVGTVAMFTQFVTALDDNSWWSIVLFVLTVLMLRITIESCIQQFFNRRVPQEVRTQLKRELGPFNEGLKRLVETREKADRLTDTGSPS